jgi:endonuclease/exonuclease/phosphatase family metal-dependent hydrolase
LRITCDRYFDNCLYETLYICSCRLSGISKKAFDLILPAIQIAAKKEPTSPRLTHLQRLHRIVLAIPGTVAVVAASPLFLLAKLVQWAIKDKMHPFVVHSRPQGPLTTNPRTSIKVATLNVFGLPNAAFMLGDKNNGESASVRLPKIANAIKHENLDLLCLQECFDPEACDLMTHELQKNFPHILSHAGESDPFGVSSGLVVASKHPILEAHYVEYPNRLGVDKMAHKGVVFVKVSLGANRVGFIATTHIQANTPMKLQTAQIRNEQLQILQQHFDEFITNHSQPDEEIVLKSVCGDFNFDNTRTRVAHIDRHELEQPATKALFHKTIDPVVDCDTKPKLPDWQRPCDPPSCGTALKYQNLSPQSPEEHLNEIEEGGTRRLDYLLFYNDCHKENPRITSKTTFIKSEEGVILTDHLMLSAKILLKSSS